MRFRTMVIFIVVAAAGQWGCRSKNPPDRFPQVQSLVKDRIGKETQWNRGTVEDHEVEESIRRMLARELTEQDVVQIALLNNRHLQATYEDLGVAQGELVQAGMLKNPLFHGNIGWIEAGGFKTSSSSTVGNFARPGTRGNPPPVPFVPGGSGGSNVTGELGFVFYFMDLMLKPLKKKIAENDLQEVQAHVAEEILSVAREARMDFLEYQAAQQVLAMHRTAADAADASFDVAQRLHKAGNLTDLALLDEQAQYSRAKLDLAAAEMRLTERREHLNRVMGLWGQAVTWKIDSHLPEVPTEEMALENLESTAVEKSLDLESLRRRIFAARQRLGLSRITGLVPDIEVGVSARNVENRWITGPMFEIPLPVFDQGQGKNAAALAELRRARQEYVAVAIDLRSEVREAQARLMSARDRAAYYQKVMLPLAHRIVEETQKNYNGMLASPLQLLDARQREVAAQSEHIRNVLDYWSARSELEQLLNGSRPGHEQSRYFERMNRGMFGEGGSATGVH